MILPCDNPKQPAEPRIIFKKQLRPSGSGRAELLCLLLLFLQAFFRFTSLPISMITANTIRYQKFSILCPTRQA